MSSGDLNKKSKSKIPTLSRFPMYLKMKKKTGVTTLMPKTKNRIVVIMVLATASSKVRMSLMMTMATNMITRMEGGDKDDYADDKDDDNGNNHAASGNNPAASGNNPTASSGGDKNNANVNSS
jgi:hypothetical protein